MKAPVLTDSRKGRNVCRGTAGLMDVLIRKEIAQDRGDVWNVHSLAFETDTEADLVDDLRETGIPIISLVAEVDGIVVGHILFSPVKLEECDRPIKIAGLAPMAVHPAFQKRGVGSKLVKEGMNACSAEGYEAVVVLGQPDYYKRFGFVPSTHFDIRSEYDVPAEVFMVKELRPHVLRGCAGTIVYHHVFKKLSQAQ